MKMRIHVEIFARGSGEIPKARFYHKGLVLVSKYPFTYRVLSSQVSPGSSFRLQGIMEKLLAINTQIQE